MSQGWLTVRKVIVQKREVTAILDDTSALEELVREAYRRFTSATYPRGRREPRSTSTATRVCASRGRDPRYKLQ